MGKCGKMILNKGGCNMDGTTVAEIVSGRKDSAGKEILCVYAKVSQVYAVYRTEERVVVQYADDPALGADQRKALAPLNPLRGQINGLIDGWRLDDRHEQSSKATLFDRRVADALVMALQGDPAHAETLLAEVKADLLEERTSPARVSYMIWAAIAAAGVLAVALAFSELLFRGEATASSLWLGTAAGAIGALFSTAIGMRTRAILTDLHWRENRMDAILRIGIGAIAGAVLVGLLLSDLIELRVGDAAVGAAQRPAWLVLALAGFFAGFSERLIPDLLDKVAVATRAAAKPPAASAVPKGGATGPAGETNPLGRPAEPAGSAAESAQVSEEAEGAEHEVDGCVSDIPISEDEITDDSQLPAAMGGVEEKPAA